MMHFKNFTAGVLDRGATAYGAFAASQLLQNHPELERLFGPNAFENWKLHLVARVQELAMALELDSPAAFAASVDWARQSFDARGLPEKDLRASLVGLQETLAEKLPEASLAPIRPYFAASLAALERPAAPDAGLDAAQPRSRLALAYIEACLAGDERNATRLLLEAVDTGLKPTEAYLEVLVPAQKEVGRLWHLGKIGTHEEHFVTATTERVMTLLAHRAPTPPVNGRTAIGATVQGNAHALGLRVLTDFLALAGWRTVHLGASLPPADVARAGRDFRADLLVLSVTLLTQLKALRETVEAVRPEAPQVKILVGGLVFAAIPHAWRWAGADAWAPDAEASIAVAEALVHRAT